MERGLGITGLFPCITKPHVIVLQIERIIFCQKIYIEEDTVLTVAMSENVFAFHVIVGKGQQLLG